MKGTVIYFDLGDTLVFGPTDDRQPFEDAVDTIAELYLRGYKIGLLSDQYPGTTLQDMNNKLTDYGFDPFKFDVITISSEFVEPLYKPDPAIFAAALTKAGHVATSERTIFVTENLTHIQAARELGWRAIHKPYEAFCTPDSGECIEDLSELLDLFPPLPIDIYIRDSPVDPGDDQYNGTGWWNSPDLWIRHKNDGGTTHQSPEYGQDNWFYARLHNRGQGIARFVSVIHTVLEWAGTQFVYPDDYWPFMAQGVAVHLDSDASAVSPAKWDAADLPEPGTDGCWLAKATAMNDNSIPAGAHVWEHNNLAQKNLTILDLIPGESGAVPVMIGNRQNAQAAFFSIELFRSANRFDLPVTLTGKVRKAFSRAVREGPAVPQHPSTAEDGSKKLGFRFLTDTCMELSGAGVEEGRMKIELKRGSFLSLCKVAEEDEKVATRPRKAVNTIPARLVENEKLGTEVIFAPGRSSEIGTALKAHQTLAAVLRFTVPNDAKPGDRFDLDLVQRDVKGVVVGGIAVQVNVKARITPQRLKEKHGTKKRTRRKTTGKKTTPRNSAKKSAKRREIG